MNKLMIAAALCVGMLTAQGTFAQVPATKQEPAKKEQAHKKSHGKAHKATAATTTKTEAKPATDTKATAKPATMKPAPKPTEKK